MLPCSNLSPHWEPANTTISIGPIFKIPDFAPTPCSPTPGSDDNLSVTSILILDGGSSRSDALMDWLYPNNLRFITVRLRCIYGKLAMLAIKNDALLSNKHVLISSLYNLLFPESSKILQGCSLVARTDRSCITTPWHRFLLSSAHFSGPMAVSPKKIKKEKKRKGLFVMACTLLLTCSLS